MSKLPAGIRTKLICGSLTSPDAPSPPRRRHEIGAMLTTIANPKTKNAERDLFIAGCCVSYLDKAEVRRQKAEVPPLR
jgi:hypothetical protein